MKASSWDYAGYAMLLHQGQTALQLKSSHLHGISSYSLCQLAGISGDAPLLAQATELASDAKPLAPLAYAAGSMPNDDQFTA